MVCENYVRALDLDRRLCVYCVICGLSMAISRLIGGIMGHHQIGVRGCVLWCVVV